MKRWNEFSSKKKETMHVWKSGTFKVKFKFHQIAKMCAYLKNFDEQRYFTNIFQHQQINMENERRHEKKKSSHNKDETSPNVH